MFHVFIQRRHLFSLLALVGLASTCGCGLTRGGKLASDEESDSVADLMATESAEPEADAQTETQPDEAVEPRDTQVVQKAVGSWPPEGAFDLVPPALPRATPVSGDGLRAEATGPGATDRLRKRPLRTTSKSRWTGHRSRH